MTDVSIKHTYKMKRVESSETKVKINSNDKTLEKNNIHFSCGKYGS